MHVTETNGYVSIEPYFVHYTHAYGQSQQQWLNSFRIEPEAGWGGGRGGDGRRTHTIIISMYICALDAIQWHWITENTLIEIEILSSSQRLSLSSVSPPSANNTLYIWKHEQQRRLLHIHGKNNIAMSEWALRLASYSLCSHIYFYCIYTIWH